MQTQQTFDTCIFQFPSWLPTESLVDKWHNQYMDIWRCTNTFVRLVYSITFFVGLCNFIKVGKCNILGKEL